MTLRRRKLPAGASPSEGLFLDQGHDDGDFIAVGKFNEDKGSSDIFLQLGNLFGFGAGDDACGEYGFFIFFAVFLKMFLGDIRGFGGRRGAAGAGRKARYHEKDYQKALQHIPKNLDRYESGEQVFLEDFNRPEVFEVFGSYVDISVYVD